MINSQLRKTGSVIMGISLSLAFFESFCYYLILLNKDFHHYINESNVLFISYLKFPLNLKIGIALNSIAIFFLVWQVLHIKLSKGTIREFKTSVLYNFMFANLIYFMINPLGFKVQASIELLLGFLSLVSAGLFQFLSKKEFFKPEDTLKVIVLFLAIILPFINSGIIQNSFDLEWITPFQNLIVYFLTIVALLLYIFIRENISNKRYEQTLIISMNTLVMISAIFITGLDYIRLASPRLKDIVDSIIEQNDKIFNSGSLYFWIESHIWVRTVFILLVPIMIFMVLEIVRCLKLDYQEPKNKI